MPESEFLTHPRRYCIYISTKSILNPTAESSRDTSEISSPRGLIQRTNALMQTSYADASSYRHFAEHIHVDSIYNLQTPINEQFIGHSVKQRQKAFRN